MVNHIIPLLLSAISFVASIDIQSLPGRCSLYGNHWISTFDGKQLQFTGDCSYQLMADCVHHKFSLQVFIEGGARVGLALYLPAQSTTIILFRNGSAIANSKLVKVPFSIAGVLLETVHDNPTIRSTTLGVQASLLPPNAISLLVSSAHAGRTCGLCGNFDSLRLDELITQEGFITEDGYVFGNSWAMKSVGQVCQHARPDDAMCQTNSTAQLEQCQSLYLEQGSAEVCRLHLDYEGLIDACEAAACTCGPREACHCPLFLEFSRVCRHAGVPVVGWISDAKCDPECSHDKVYSECATPCPRTCQNLHMYFPCDDTCIDGCVCPDDFVLNRGRCVKPDDCPCVQNDKEHSAGTIISQDCNQCVCKQGSWLCTNKECPGFCSLVGQGHYRTYDGKFFMSHGRCQYIFTKDCKEGDFSILVETVQCGDAPEAVCLNSVTVILHRTENITVLLKHGGTAALNGIGILMPFHQGLLTIWRALNSDIRMVYGDIFALEWDGRGALYVELSVSYTERVCGLCGNFDGNAGDDLRGSSGLLEVRITDFVSSWRAASDCQDEPAMPEDPCNHNIQRGQFAEEACGILGLSEVFGSCHRIVPLTPFIRRCTHDVCACDDAASCLCRSLEAFAKECSYHGVPINWRRDDLCPMLCPHGLIYRSCGFACNHTCPSLALPGRYCRDTCQEGCFCPPGLLMASDGVCVKPSDCLCEYRGQLYQPGEMVVHRLAICYCENGVMECTAEDPTPVSLMSTLTATNASLREKRSLYCEDPFHPLLCYHGTSSGAECSPTCQTLGHECTSQICVSGCVCPSGLVKLEDKCVPSDICPCYHHGKAYEPGKKIAVDCNTCVCKDRKWSCTDIQCPRSCLTLGATNFLTFDGSHYTFGGSCRYILAQDFCGTASGTFRIVMESIDCESDMAAHCTKNLYVYYRGTEVEFANGRPQIKKKSVSGADINLISSGSYYIMATSGGLSILWDKGTRVVVKLSPHYRSVVCGLCGNFNGNQNDDLTSSTNELEVQVSIFGNSWKTDKLCPDSHEQPRPCQGQSTKLRKAEAACAIIQSDIFHNCFKWVPMEEHYDACVSEACRCEAVGECTCVCDSVATYAHACAQAGVPVQWRSQTFCPMSCEMPDGEHEAPGVCEWHYEVCGPACLRTCQAPNVPDCPFQCLDGCYGRCPNGSLWDEYTERCVRTAECPVCHYNDEVVPEGRLTIFHRHDPNHCEICLCSQLKLSCDRCPPISPTPIALQITSEATMRDVTVSSPVILPPGVPPEAAVLPTVPPDGCDKVMELAILLDSSDGFSEHDFERAKDFVAHTMHRMHIGQSRVRVALMQFHVGPLNAFSLPSKMPTSGLLGVVKKLRYFNAEQAFVGEALKYSSVYTLGALARKGVPKVALVITAGRSADKPGKGLKLARRKGIRVVMAAVGRNVDLQLLRAVREASSGNKVFNMASMNELQQVEEYVVRSLCNIAKAPKPTSVPTMPMEFPQTEKPLISRWKSVSLVLPMAATTDGSPLSTYRPMDLIFALEDSDTVGERAFEMMKDFVQEVVQEVDIGENETKVGIVQFAEKPIVTLALEQYQQKEEVMETIKNMTFHGGDTVNTGAAIESALAEEMPGRPDIPKIMFLLTASRANDTISRPAEEAQKEGLAVFPIGVGEKTDMEQLEELGTFPAIAISSFDQLGHELAKDILDTCCLPDTILPTKLPLSQTHPASSHQTLITQSLKICTLESCPPPPECGPHRILNTTSGPCCSLYKCICACAEVSSPAPCPRGHSQEIQIDECGCRSVSCWPREVCVEGSVERPVGERWKKNCSECRCERRAETTKELGHVICLPIFCDSSCPLGSIYVKEDGECCGVCKRKVCIDVSASTESRGDMDVGGTIYKVGDRWPSPTDPCRERECLEFHGEAFTHEINVSCQTSSPSDCPLGTLLDCSETRRCCPLCRCVPGDFCTFNDSTLLRVGETLFVNECKRCHCQRSRTGDAQPFTFLCRETKCAKCAEGFEEVKPEGACCGTCMPTECRIVLKNGTKTIIKPDHTLKDGCDKYSCQKNTQGGISWQRRTTICPPLDRNSCLNSGGRIESLEDTCCDTCVQAQECKVQHGVLKYIKVGDCKTERPVNITFCEGRCISSAVYSISSGRVAPNCRCCSALETRTVVTPLHCHDGSTQSYNMTVITTCDCKSTHCG
uniref:von Willebrand factor n=1 Tax=Myxine glutinosa TaxID=7769 RepID=A0A2L0HIL2_MYXGL|nr:von Willebrand factor [Myxine glutinosa]